MKNLNCFIASAFGHNDIDKIYDKVIKVTLKEFKIKASRVDKINHNDKIDSKIIQLINDCDFGIADLTNARPSVYYEAGLLEGQNKKVIYICRKDHFSSHKDDLFGNKKVHFDLITKNIISWSEPNKSFQNQLRARISLIAKPLIIKLNKSNEESESQRNFESVSVNERLKLVNETLNKFVEKKGYKPFYDRYNKIFFEKNGTILKVETYHSILKNDLTFSAYRDPIIHFPHKLRIKVLCSLNSMPKKRIQSFLKIYHPVADNIFKHEGVRLIFLDSITSIYKLERMLGNLKLD